MKSYTIKEIAKMANVSRGTVDRVLHTRSRVSLGTKKKVDAVLEKLDYKPNILAQSLKNHKKNKIALVVPDNKVDAYWNQPVIGAGRAVKELVEFGIRIDHYFYDPNVQKSFGKTASKLIMDRPDGVLIAPLLMNESLSFLKDCEHQGIPVITFNTDVGLDTIPFIGQNLYQSGRLAAQLIHYSSTRMAKVLIVHVDEDLDPPKKKSVDFDPIGLKLVRGVRRFSQ